MTNDLSKFMTEFDLLLDKYSIDDVILVNFDDNTMGCRQLMKIVEDKGNKFLCMSYSGKGEILCPCCKDEHERKFEDEVD